MKIILGPVLSLRTSSEDSWTVSALFVVQGSFPNPTVNESGQETSPVTLLLSRKNHDIYRFDMKIKLGITVKEIEYGVGQEKWQFSVPAKSTQAQMAFASCNGFSSAKEIKNVSDKNALWRRLLNNHQQTPYNILLMGGDQVYADEIWEKCSAIKKWVELPRDVRRKRNFTVQMKGQVDQFYFDLYLERWKQAPTNQALAAIPTLMMWDDHDIFDGWGSYSDEDQTCPVYQGIFSIAKKYFSLFQQQLKDDGTEQHPSYTTTNNFSTCLDVGNQLILALDARTERSQKQVLSESSWEKIWDILDTKTAAPSKQFKHLFVIAPVPIVHADFGKIERIMNWLPGEQELEDDMRDHWQSGPHRAERLRLIHRLFDFMEKHKCRVTILSGDVHVACFGVIESERSKSASSREGVINQLTASGIVHPAPPKLMGYLLDQLSADPEVVTQGITATMLEFPTLRKKYVLSRNFLSLEPDEDNRIWANWNVEGEDHVLKKVIHPV